MEEIDLCWRMARKGWKLGYFGQVTVYHVGGGTLARTSPYKTYLNFRNNLLMLYGNMTKGGFIGVMLLRFFFDMAASVHFALSGKAAHAKEVVKAYRDFFKMRRRPSGDSALALKLPFQKANKEVYSVVLSYYLLGRKNYPEL
ncbi:glycosyltransferase family 2 protein [Echinicola strongylocentroti]|uniref:glycosyltransferase family 2 protein n=1 Tax=Echinicola strongylocentroti TaxID=1795355 RepID=UPI001FEC60B7|nr:hypothetical protein [Echinicola strongylocentroti]